MRRRNSEVDMVDFYDGAGNLYHLAVLPSSFHV